MPSAKQTEDIYLNLSNNLSLNSVQMVLYLLQVISMLILVVLTAIVEETCETT